MERPTWGRVWLMKIAERSGMWLIKYLLGLYDVIASGSLLGVHYKRIESIRGGEGLTPMVV